jgi:hypothetical protein
MERILKKFWNRIMLINLCEKKNKQCISKISTMLLKFSSRKFCFLVFNPESIWMNKNVILRQSIRQKQCNNTIWKFIHMYYFQPVIAIQPLRWLTSCHQRLLSCGYRSLQIQAGMFVCLFWVVRHIETA